MGNLNYVGVPAGFDNLVIADLATENKTVLVVLSDDKRVANTIAGLRFFAPHVEIIQIPAWDCLPYDSVSPRRDIISRRISAMFQILKNEAANARVIIVTISALLQRLPSRILFEGAVLRLVAGEEWSRDLLIGHLEKFGYMRTETVFELGEYAVRGNLIDLYPAGQSAPVRVDYFGDKIESIKIFDPSSQLSDSKLPSFWLMPMREFRIDRESISKFRIEYRSNFGAVQKDDYLYASISEGQYHLGMDHWLPLFDGNLETIFEYVSDCPIICDYQMTELIEARMELITDCYQSRLGVVPKGEMSLGRPYNPLPPGLLYLKPGELEEKLRNREVIKFFPYSSPERTGDTLDKGGKPGQIFRSATNIQGANAVELLIKYINEVLDEGKRTVLACHSNSSRERMITILFEHGLNVSVVDTNWSAIQDYELSCVAAVVLPLERGFYTSTLCVICEQDIFGDRLYTRSRKTKKIENFISEVSSLTEGDLVVHNEHGIGKFNKLVTVNVSQVDHDCLMLIYDGGDKLFLPVENIEVISRYGPQNSAVRLDKLGGGNWQSRHAQLKKRIREIAKELISVAAARQLRDGEVYQPQKGIYEEFCSGFQYEETEDQIRAIEDVISDLGSGKPMDRLICGDVGFGKTEVALRAAFISVLEGKQAAVIVPTTLLARQHYFEFKKRFANFPIQIKQLSRLVTRKEAAKTKRLLSEGTIDVVIGTHALLANDVKFLRLGILIIDEEQHFGVIHKERMKQLKTNVHVLTLTATPIPRTLQLALTGVRELSLITTPPVDRLAVRTFILPTDPMVIREAIRREICRGGQVFYVCPKIRDISRLKVELQKLMPELRIAIAHGQLSPSHIEEIMEAFYEGGFDLLLTTNIIESGLDLPSVNTIIIHRADQFGLSQLYQLRGRIGRAKVRGYALLTLPQRQKLTVAAQKRLEVMQTLDGLGAGFALASHDLDIRGAGNLLGDEQSGHIKEVGIELYQKMLEEAVKESKDDSFENAVKEIHWIPQIDIGVPILIPSEYVSDLGVRLSLYRRIGGLSDETDIIAFSDELLDRFGVLPREVENLLDTVKIKQECRLAGIDKIEAGPKGATVSFRNNSFENTTELVEFIAKQEGSAKLRTDHKLVLMRPWQEQSDRLTGLKWLIHELAMISSK